MPSTIALAPLYKGDAPPPSGADESALRQMHEAMLTGVDPATHQPLERETYVQSLLKAKSSNRQLVENVARVGAANARALLLKGEGYDSQMLYVEGCTWDWGQKKRTGAETSLAIHQGVVPHEFRMSQPNPIVTSYSARTLDEMRKALGISAFLPHISKAEFVTHSYHQERSAAIAAEAGKEVSPHYSASIVHTPGDIADMLENRAKKTGMSEGYERFMIDVIRTAEPEEQVRIEEESKEKKLRLLMRARQITGGRIDPEAIILRLMKMLKSR